MYGVTAKLVYDGGNKIHIPDEMNVPSNNQMKGTLYEQLSELACRVCYDSLGRGRSSQDLHKHILEVGHLSVYEHPHVTVQLSERSEEDFMTLLNRPGIWTRGIKYWWESYTYFITFNPRVILDWNNWSNSVDSMDMVGDPHCLGDILSYHAERLFPQIVNPKIRDLRTIEKFESISKIVEPETDEEKWITLFLMGSRGFSHELVRHGDFTAISQRSTRYVDEDEAQWIDHPLVQEFLNYDKRVGEWHNSNSKTSLAEYLGFSDVEYSEFVKDNKSPILNVIDVTKQSAKIAYKKVYTELQKWLLSKGVDKFTARKQARGAARGYLGNALSTELIFSASVGQWKRMLKLRCSDGADAEIRVIFMEILKALKSSKYSTSFNDFNLIPAQDGIGMVVNEKN